MFQTQKNIPTKTQNCIPPGDLGFYKTSLPNRAAARASMDGRIGILMTMLSLGADPNVSLDQGWTPVLLAIWFNHIDALRILVESGANLKTRTIEGCTPLMIAAWNCSTEIVRYLLEQPHEINACDNTGKTALMWAVQKGNIEIVRILRDAGAATSP